MKIKVQDMDSLKTCKPSLSLFHPSCSTQYFEMPVIIWPDFYICFLVCRKQGKTEISDFVNPYIGKSREFPESELTGSFRQDKQFNTIWTGRRSQNLGKWITTVIAKQY